MFASLFVVFGGAFELSVIGGFSLTFRAAYPGIIKLMGGLTFPVALIFILFAGGDLFTGNCFMMAMCWVSMCYKFFFLLLEFFLLLLCYCCQ